MALEHLLYSFISLAKIILPHDEVFVCLFVDEIKIKILNARDFRVDVLNELLKKHFSLLRERKNSFLTRM